MYNLRDGTEIVCGCLCMCHVSNKVFFSFFFDCLQSLHSDVTGMNNSNLDILSIWNKFMPFVFGISDD